MQHFLSNPISFLIGQTSTEQEKKTNTLADWDYFYTKESMPCTDFRERYLHGYERERNFWKPVLISRGEEEGGEGQIIFFRNFHPKYHLILTPQNHRNSTLLEFPHFKENFKKFPPIPPIPTPYNIW